MNDKRLYGIDLFKALAMFLVVVLHVNTLGTAFDSSVPGSAQWWLTDGMMTAAYCCVDCFALATGFLMAERAFRPGRIVSLWRRAFSWQSAHSDPAASYRSGFRSCSMPW